MGRKLTDEELVVFKKGQGQRKYDLDEKRRKGPKSGAERVREHVARANDIGDFNIKPRHPRLKELCRTRFDLFIIYYGRRVLKHLPSKRIKDGLIHDVQETIIHGGKSVKEYGRGTGKTTIIWDLGVTWAVLYGWRRYPIGISATGKLAKKNLKSVKRILSRTPEIRQDFPAIVIPILALGDVSQRSTSQTYHGRPTDIEWSADQIVLPMLRDENGEPLDRGCGAIIGCVGVGGAVRGANEGGQRPDFLIIDDPQDRKTAHSPSMVEAVINYIHQDALMLAGHDRTISAFVTITPQCFGDVATELCSRTKHPEWSVSIEPFVVKKCPKWDRLVIEFVEKYVEDAANNDSQFTRSKKWYRDHREDFAAVEVIDPEQYDHENEVDAVHHVLNLRALLGESAFNAEIMMDVADSACDIAIDADVVSNALNGAPRNVCPPGTDSVIVFADVNITNSRGISWVAMAFGPKRVAAVINYGRFPERGPLVPPNSSDVVRNRLVAAGMKSVIERVANLPIRDAKGRRVPITALGFDRGYLPAVIHRVLYVIRKTKPIPFNLVAMRGFPWNKFGVREKDTLRRGDHVFATRSKYGQYLAEMAPYWREKMQSSFLETPLMPGSLSLFGNSPIEHFEFANEICAEKLIRRYTVYTKGKSETAWDWQTLGDNHFCDCATGCFALASWYHCYDNLSAIIDGVVTAPAPVKPAAPALHQDDLFNPMKNAAVVESAGYDRGCEKELAKYLADHAADETEGTGEEVAPHSSEEDYTDNPLIDIDNRKAWAQSVKSIECPICHKGHAFDNDDMAPLIMLSCDHCYAHTKPGLSCIRASEDFRNGKLIKLGVDPAPAVPVHRKLSTHRLHRVHKFKRGRFKK